MVRRLVEIALQNRTFVAVFALMHPFLLCAQDKAKAPEPPKAPESPDTNPRLWQPRTRSVAVFKNGMGFFLREGDAALHEEIRENCLRVCNKAIENVEMFRSHPAGLDWSGS